jgi:hypothetical protein
MSDEITKADVLAARKMIAKLSELEPEIAIAQACGIDCQEEADRCKQMKEFLIRFNELRGASIPPR